MSEMHDPYEDQLAAARYRAERDQARRELARDRLRRCRGAILSLAKLDGLRVSGGWLRDEETGEEIPLLRARNREGQMGGLAGLRLRAAGNHPAGPHGGEGAVMAAAFRCPICGGVVETDIQIGNISVGLSFFCRKCGEYIEYDITDEYLTRAANARLDFARKVERIEGRGVEVGDGSITVLLGKGDDER